jgi:hypothetical protein
LSRSLSHFACGNEDLHDAIFTAAGPRENTDLYRAGCGAREKRRFDVPDVSDLSISPDTAAKGMRLACTFRK